MITAALIVKDEELTLPICLRSIKDWVDHIVVVDTGSTDNTVAIAESFGTQVEHFAWCDDFSAARNYAKSFVKTPWTLTLDADDILLNPEKLAVSAAYAHKHHCNSVWSEYLQSQNCKQKRNQLFKTKEYKWEGVVHETPQPKKGFGCAAFMSDLQVMHRKPNNRPLEAAKKYLDILLKKDPENWFGIAESYRVLKQWEKAVAYYDKAAQYEHVNKPTRYISLFYAAKMSYQEVWPEKKEKTVIDYAMRAAALADEIYPERAEAKVLMGQIMEAFKQYDEALLCYEEALACSVPEGDIGIVFPEYYGEIPQRLIASLPQRQAA